MYRFATSNSQETYFKVHQRLNLTSIQDKLSAQMANSWASIRSFTNKQMLFSGIQVWHTDTLRGKKSNSQWMWQPCINETLWEGQSENVTLVELLSAQKQLKCHVKLRQNKPIWMYAKAFSIHPFGLK